jgi:N-acetylglucosamine malate deacetylase 1
MKLDILVMAAHPDDAELACSGTILKHIAAGKKVGIVDFTKGELGTRGTPEIRAAESAEATRILGIHARENLGFRDGFFQNDEAHQLALIQIIRKYQPEIVLANGIDDRHPDHGRAALLANDACFKSGLRMIKTVDETGNEQVAWRPQNVFHYIQDRYIKPDFIIDISEHWEKKIASVSAFKSQFFKDPNDNEPSTYLTNADFLDFIHARAKEFGHNIGVAFGEGYTSPKKVGIRDLFDLV